MKRQILTLVGGLSLLLAAGSAYAQTIHVKADVPFGFIADKASLAPGQYMLQTVGSDRVVLIRSADNQPVAILISNAVKTTEPSEKTKLVFRRYGDRYFLSQIWVAGENSGHQLRKGAREAEMARGARSHAEVVAALSN